MFPIRSRLRVLQVHNAYAPGWGGEDTVVELERQLLLRRGHAVEQFQASHASLKSAPVLRQILAVPGFLWSQRSYRVLQRKINDFQPDVIHVHNTFPRISPSVFWAAGRAGVPVVQTLHNFRSVCANSILLRNNTPCDRCVGKSQWPAVRYRCYSNSFARTAAIVAMNALHSKLGTYRCRVNGFIVFNEFNREIFHRGHFPDDRMFTKANFVPSWSLESTPRLRQAIFVGTISQAKGVPLLLEAWAMSAPVKFKLLLVGDGPDRESLQQRHANLSNVEWCGKLERSELLRRVATSRILVCPSLAYEGCPMVVLEALSVATPVVASDYPSLKAIIRHDCEGLLFEPGSAYALSLALSSALSCSDETWSAWSKAARQTHTRRYSEAVNYDQLIDIYQAVIAAQSARPAAV